MISSSSSTKPANLVVNIDEKDDTEDETMTAAIDGESGFSTPEGTEHRIPTPTFCPPAPMRKRKERFPSPIPQIRKAAKMMKGLLLSPPAEIKANNLVVSEKVRTPNCNSRKPKYFR